jgi:conjugal transfer pilus assembly protein TrbC
VPAPIEHTLLTGALLLTSCVSIAQNPQWPNAIDMEQARKSRPFPSRERIGTEPIPRPPEIDIKRPNIDLEALVRARPKQQSASTPSSPLRIFITLDMPRGSLQRLAEQSARTGAVLVLRGLKGESMRATLAAIQGINGDQTGAWTIDPEAFVRYGVQQAPTFVLTLSSTLDTPLNCGTQCPISTHHVQVSGDVSIDYALEAIVHRHPDATKHATPILQRLRSLR